MSEPREQKARGKHWKTGRWIYGVYWKHIKRTPSPIGDWVMPEDIKHVIIHDEFSDWNMPREMEAECVDPETVGWSTGMFDVNKTEIFEGDLVDGADFDAEDGYGVVEWDASEGKWAIHAGSVQFDFSGYWPDELEVVGNIYDRT